MDSFKDVLEAAQAYCKTQMAEPTYNLYIDGLEPISFEDSSHITLSVRNDFICKIVTDRYLGLLKEAFKTVLGFDVDITLVVPSTPPHEVVLAQQYEANPASPQGNYEFTFENFIKGPSNQFAFAAAQAVAANPSGAYNPLFIYGGSGLEPAAQIHNEVTAEIIKRLHEQGTISKRSTLQFYDAKAGTFLNGRQVIGHCPVRGCKSEKAYADECDLGHQFDPEELIAPKSQLTGEVPELRFIQMERSAETFPMSELWPLLGNEEREGPVEMSEMQRT